MMKFFHDEYDPIAEVKFGKEARIDDQLWTMEVLDTGGKYFTYLHDSWLRKSEGFILVYTTSSQASFDCIHNIHNKLTTSIGAPKDKLLPGQFITLIGTQLDPITEREVSRETGWSTLVRWAATSSRQPRSAETGWTRSFMVL